MPRVSRLTWCAEVKLCRPIFDAFPALQELEFALPLTIPDDYETWNFSKLTSLAFTYTPAWQSYCSMIEMQECIVDMVKMMRQRKSQKLKIPFFAWVYAKQHLEQHGIACEVWMDMTGQALARREMEELEERYWVMRNAYPGMHYSSVLDELSGGARSRNMVTHNL
ncbi:hypothetical protein AX16_004866 [Volvariella volvacea WC 439]|nr:hypothetical protein AX16_004866 [Volvariella volvacea WC 439]